MQENEYGVEAVHVENVFSQAWIAYHEYSLDIPFVFFLAITETNTSSRLERGEDRFTGPPDVREVCATWSRFTEREEWVMLVVSHRDPIGNSRQNGIKAIKRVIILIEIRVVNARPGKMESHQGHPCAGTTINCFWSDPVIRTNLMSRRPSKVRNEGRSYLLVNFSGEFDYDTHFFVPHICTIKFITARECIHLQELFPPFHFLDRIVFKQKST
ncbi:UNVERIFIED_CONTAM: hypothetical protein Sradi_2025700 [Sesamum radiatum]|uniref:Uncharacterized protein n=1 Tax=Sesamum radiatum TaxID=300843 RepID=A0AAW2THB1_SESRA